MLKRTEGHKTKKSQTGKEKKEKRLERRRFTCLGTEPEPNCGLRGHAKEVVKRAKWGDRG